MVAPNSGFFAYSTAVIETLMYANNMGGGGWAVSIIGMVIIVALIVAVVIWIASDRGVRRE